MKRTFTWGVALALGLASPAFAHQHTEDARFKEMVSLFETADVIGKPSMVPCKLSGGVETNCLKITTIAAPANHDTGPFCPRTISSTADESGTWVKDGEVYNVDGKFIENLATFYDDDEWQMFDPKTGKVTLVEGRLGCEVAGDPTSADRYKNTCVECDVEFMGDDDVTQTYFIPLKPTKFLWRGAKIGKQSGVGLALNGVKFDAPAPLHLILGGHTLGPFDDCVGHGNPHGGYHYHGVAGCEEQAEASIPDHAPIIGVSMDGYNIHTRTDRNGKEPDDLDRCRGHDVKGLGYHYHANSTGSNQIIGCFASQVGCVLSDLNGECDATSKRKRP